MSERIEAMDQITQNMDREFKSSRVVRFIIAHFRNCEEAGLSNVNSNESIDFQIKQLASKETVVLRRRASETLT